MLRVQIFKKVPFQCPPHPCVTLRMSACLRMSLQNTFREALTLRSCKCRVGPESMSPSVLHPRYLTCLWGSPSEKGLDPSPDAAVRAPVLPAISCVPLSNFMSPISCLSWFYDSRAYFTPLGNRAKPWWKYPLPGWIRSQLTFHVFTGAFPDL